MQKKVKYSMYQTDGAEVGTPIWYKKHQCAHLGTDQGRNGEKVTRRRRENCGRKN
jgi:hypothetical protein